MIRAEWRATGIESLKPGRINGIVRNALGNTGMRWRSRYLRLHFGNAAATRYSYTPRSGERGSGRAYARSYTAQKAAKYGHTRPLELSGSGRREAESSKVVNPVANKNGARVEIPLPRKFNLRGKGSKVNMADEIRAVLPVELSDLSQFLTDELESGFNQAGAYAAVTATLT